MILDKPMGVRHAGEKGQTCVIHSVHVHPDGSRFATGGGDHRVKIWSMAPFRSTASSSTSSSIGALHAATATSSTQAAPPPTRATTATTSSHVQGEEVEVLAVLPQHTGSVNCVRWSHGGRYLASTSDDMYVLIWELRPGDAAGSSGSFGSNDVPNKENWARVWVLRGHNMDVLDCTWSPDDSMVVSGSIDNTIIVWRMPTADVQGRILNPFQTLRQHTNFVKGVAWDPIGRFIASIGEDNRLLVWRVGGDWGVEATISEPFDDCEDTLVRRISWSPDGQFLIATNSKDGDIHRAVVFTRGLWDKPPTSLVGNSQSTLAAAFSPIMYHKRSATATAVARSSKAKETRAVGASDGPSSSGSSSSRGSRPGVHHVVAIAGRDNVITIWLAAESRPVAILKEVFQQPPSDLAWAPDGYTLLISGHDGVVVVLRFSTQEIGLPLPESERQAHFIKTYGTDAGVPGGIALVLDGAPSLVDNPRQLALERSRKEQRKRESEIAAPGTGGVNGMVQIAGGRASSHGGAGTQNTRVLQVESRGKSGKRRIQPVLLSNGGGGVSGSGAGGGSSAPPLALPDTSARWQGAPGAGTVSEGFGPNATAGTGGTSSPRLGHKRPRISAGSGASHSRQHTVGVRSRDGVVVRLRAAGGGGSASSLVSPPELMPRRGATGSLVRQIEGRSVGGVGQGEGNGAFRPSPRIRDAPSSSIVVAGMPDDHGVRSTGDGGSGIAGSSGGSSRNGGSAVMECSALDEDFRGLPARRYTVVAVTRGGREVWRDYVAGMATACCGNARVAAVGAEDGSVYVYDRNGVRSAPPLVITPPVAHLECNDSSATPSERQSRSPQAVMSAAHVNPGDYLMAISGDGDVFVWNLGTMTLAAKSTLVPLFRSVASSGVTPPPRSSTVPTLISTGTGPSSGGSGGGSSGGDGLGVAPGGGAGGKLLPNVSVARAGVTAEGMPLVMLACQGAFGGALQAYALHQGLGTWLRMADGRFALSDFYSSGPCTSPANRGCVLSALQTGVRTGSSPTPAALLQASRAGAQSPALSAGSAVAAAGRGAKRESLQSAVTRSHLEDSLGAAVLLGSAEEFMDVLKAYAGHLAKNAAFGDGRIRALCDKLLLAAGGLDGVTTGGGRGETASESGKLLGLRLGFGPSILGVKKLHLLKEIVLPALSSNRSLQRLINEYYDTIDLASEVSPPPLLSTTNARGIAPSPAGDAAGAAVATAISQRNITPKAVADVGVPDGAAGNNGSGAPREEMAADAAGAVCYSVADRDGTVSNGTYTPAVGNVKTIAARIDGKTLGVIPASDARVGQTNAVGKDSSIGDSSDRPHGGETVPASDVNSSAAVCDKSPRGPPAAESGAIVANNARGGHAPPPPQSPMSAVMARPRPPLPTPLAGVPANDNPFSANSSSRGVSKSGGRGGGEDVGGRSDSNGKGNNGIGDGTVVESSITSNFPATTTTAVDRAEAKSGRVGDGDPMV